MYRRMKIHLCMKFFFRLTNFGKEYQAWQEIKSSLDDWGKSATHYARQTLLLANEQKKCTWTLLGKHYTRDQLHAKGIHKECNYLDLFEAPQLRRQTPVLLERYASIDMILIGPDDEVDETEVTSVYYPVELRPERKYSLTPEAKYRSSAATPASASTITWSGSPNSSNYDDSSDD